MLERLAMKKLLEWKSGKTKQAVLLTGARQVGKTTLVREFAAREYDDLAEINFYESPRSKETLSQASDAADLLLRLSVLSGKTLMPGKSLLFLDEIQECEDVLTWVKFLVEQYGLDIVLSGSLLGVGEHVSVRSLPVGFLSKIRMYPLRFEEFCLATGVLRQAWDAMEEAVRELRQVPDFIHEQLMDRFRKYLLVGGMPDAVQAFVDSGQITPVREIQRAIFDLYEDDMAKYVESPVESRQIKMVYEAIPAQLNASAKRFKYARLGKNLRFANMETAFDWLEGAGVAIEATRVGQTAFPLGLAEDRSSFKLFMSDVGILTSRLMGDVDIDVINGKTDINYGSIFENVVAQELKAAGFAPHYYATKARGEVDFVVEDLTSGRTCVMEVKSGKDYKRHSALNNVLNAGEADNALILHDGNVEIEGRKWYLPVYAVSLLEPGSLLS